jgi:hypothetical protein
MANLADQAPGWKTPQGRYGPDSWRWRRGPGHHRCAAGPASSASCLLNRSVERAEGLGAHFAQHFPARHVLSLAGFMPLMRFCGETGLLVNTTALGMEGQPPLPSPGHVWQMAQPSPISSTRRLTPPVGLGPPTRSSDRRWVWACCCIRPCRGLSAGLVSVQRLRQRYASAFWMISKQKQRLSMIRLGLTGSIATGKSTTAQLLPRRACRSMMPMRPCMPSTARGRRAGRRADSNCHRG